MLGDGEIAWDIFESVMKRLANAGIKQEAPFVLEDQVFHKGKV